MVTRFLLFTGLLGGIGAAADMKDTHSPSSGKKLKKIYRSHTQIDFSGETVQGKVRAPEIYYIFQRKRSTASHVVEVPQNLDYQHEDTANMLQKALPR